MPTISKGQDGKGGKTNVIYRLMAYVPEDPANSTPQMAWKNKIYKVLYTSDVNEIINRMSDCMEAKLQDPELNLHYHLLRDGVELTSVDEELKEILQFAKWRLGGLD